MTVDELIDVGLYIAKSIIKRHDDSSQPIPLSTGEVYTLARTVEELNLQIQMVKKMVNTESEDPHDAPIESPLAYPPELEHLTKLHSVLRTDEIGLKTAAKSYGDSWKRRGGVGAYMMLARKWDRLEQRVKEYGWNVFAALSSDKRREGTIDDIRDLRRYLALVECEAIQQRLVQLETTTKDTHEPPRMWVGAGRVEDSGFKLRGD